MPTETRQKVLQVLVEKVVIGETDIDIAYSCITSAADRCKSQPELGYR
jgi:hypothetical protein